MYTWLNGIIFKCGPNHVLRSFVAENEVFDILRACHDESSRGNYSVQRTIHKICGAGYYWPSLFKDVKKYV